MSPALPLPERARALAAAVRRAGGHAYIVGGWVRDQLIGLTPGDDIDVEVYGLDAQALRRVLASLGRVDAVGEAFTVFKVAGFDVALPRRDSKTGRGHRGFEVVGDPHMTPAEAVRRRDFTINALMIDPLAGEVIDLVGGRRDLEDRVLRAVDRSTFADDSLRVLRGLQFAARFELRMEPDTLALCATLALDDLPSERIFAELEKLLMLARRPSVGLELGRHVGAVGKLWPELAALVGCPQDPGWHPEGDVWVHTLMVVDGARSLVHAMPRGQALAVLLGAICHDFGKPATTAFSDGRVRSIGHEAEGLGPAAAFLDRLRVHTIDGVDVRKQVLGMVQFHLAPGMWHTSPSPVSDGAFRRLAQKVDLELLALLARADCEGRTGGFDCSAMDWFLARAKALGVEHRPPAPLLLGRHVLALGLAPGPAVGRILKAVYERQLDGEVSTLDEAIALASRLTG